MNPRCYKDILEAEEDRVETGLARDDMEATGGCILCEDNALEEGETM